MSDAKALLTRALSMNNPLIVKSMMEYYFKSQYWSKQFTYFTSYDYQCQ